ncbi:MAG: hypothetical protein B7O98_09460 [Zestosphaera tikiterensis]|uniref:Uncharacterized protein n=1 Tax=Zestosphaera tikiterensis TaxID=1973259 RepID=A0A2R7Y1B9_9CREN|nr:MAG: hypothetical protein B7O98_09460 [Zestosphaera tikiterensis]
MSWRGLKEKLVDMPIWRWEYNAIIESLNDLKQWIDSKTSLVPVKYAIQSTQLTLDATENRQTLLLEGPGLILIGSDGNGEAVFTILVLIDGNKQLKLSPNEKSLFAVAFSSGIELDIYNPWAEQKTATIPGITVIGLAKSVKSVDTSLVSASTGEIRVI